MEKTYTLNLTAEELDIVEFALSTIAVYYSDHFTTRRNPDTEDFYEERYNATENIRSRVFVLLGEAEKDNQ